MQDLLRASARWRAGWAPQSFWQAAPQTEIVFKDSNFLSSFLPVGLLCRLVLCLAASHFPGRVLGRPLLGGVLGGCQPFGGCL